MVIQQCTEHLFGNMVLKIEGEQDKKYVACLMCGFKKSEKGIWKENVSTFVKRKSEIKRK